MGRDRKAKHFICEFRYVWRDRGGRIKDDQRLVLEYAMVLYPCCQEAESSHSRKCLIDNHLRWGGIV